MEKFDIRTAKYVSIIILICLVFVLAVADAYKYLPSGEMQNPHKNIVEEFVNIDAKEEDLEQEDIEEDEIEESEETEIIETEIETTAEEITKSKPFEIISEEDINSNEKNYLNEYKKVLDNAKSYEQQENFSKALNEYEKALTFTNSNDEKAFCYERFALIHAKNKHYGTALSYIQKAYNLSPTTQREILLARIYYKLGETDKATIRVNNILKRDFSMDK